MDEFLHGTARYVLPSHARTRMHAFEHVHRALPICTQQAIRRVRKAGAACRQPAPICLPHVHGCIHPSIHVHVGRPSVICPALASQVPGEGVMMLDYKGVTYSADLLPNGCILCDETQFESPSAFSIYIKRKTNPER